MSTACLVLDAGVVIAMLETEDVHHSWSVQLLRRVPPGSLAISALTLAESIVRAAGAGRGAQALADLRALGMRVVDVSGTDVPSLAEMRATSGLRMPDAIVLSTAISVGGVLATTDTRLARTAAERGLVVHSPMPSA